MKNQVSHGMLATRYNLPPPQVTADNNNEPHLADAEEVFNPLIHI